MHEGPQTSQHTKSKAWDNGIESWTSCDVWPIGMTHIKTSINITMVEIVII